MRSISGSKGIIHSTGGYLVYNYSAYKWVFDLKEESVYWCSADVGWVTGHSSIVYAPLAHGAAIVLYEEHPITQRLTGGGILLRNTELMKSQLFY
jgi:acyl-coenzyme A synthetase/AMP-(fatty) acid ligase